MKSETNAALMIDLIDKGEKLLKIAKNINFPILIIIGSKDKIIDLNMTKKFFNKVSFFKIFIKIIYKKIFNNSYLVKIKYF